MEPLGCARVEDLLPLYPRGDLPRATFAAVTRHVTTCRRCREVLAEVQAGYRLLQRYLNTAPAGDRQQTKAVLLARLGGPPDEWVEPPAGAPVPARVPVRLHRQQAALPWSLWPGSDSDAPGRR